MKAKRLLKFIHGINYTIGYEKNDIPLTDYDEGFKAACNVIIGGIKGISWTPMRNLYHRFWIWRCRRVSVQYKAKGESDDKFDQANSSNNNKNCKGKT